MPIPFILGAAALFGAAKTIDALDTMDRAKAINREAQEIADNAKKKYEISKRNCNATIANLGKSKINIKQTSIKKFRDTFLRIHNLPFEYNVKINELREEAINDEKLTGNVEGFGFTDFAAVGAVGYVLGALNPVTIAFSGLFLGDKADTALYNAKSNRDQARLYEEKCNSACSFLNAVSDRGYQIYKLLERLNDKFIPTVSELQNIVAYYGTDYKRYDYATQQKVRQSYSESDLIRIILNTPMLTEDGKNVNPKIIGLINQYN